jgi:uncharacterized protein YggE
MKPRATWGAAGLIVGLALALSLPTIAQETDQPPSASAEWTVRTSGTAIVRSAPDEALVTLGVRTDAATAEQAMDRNAEAMADVLAALLDAGLAEGDLATSSISLYPRWNASGTAVDGFTAENQVTATVRDMDRVGAVIDRAVAAGANLTGGITFRVSDQNEAADRALAEAVADARRKAEALAAAGGAGLGTVIAIDETSSSVSPPVLYDEGAVAADAVTPVLPPTLESSVTVSVTWELV